MASVLASSSSPPALCDSVDVAAEFALDFSAKLRIEEPGLSVVDEEEFSFVCGDLSETLASADELFHNGQIRPKFPFFVDECEGGSPLRPPLKKLFVERRDISSPALEDSESIEWNRAPPVRSYCRWSNKKTTEVLNQRCEKSNSTGFSKLWRFRDLKLRSNSDGKDAFVFLTASTKKRASSGTTEAEKAVNVKGKAEKIISGEGKKDAVRKSKSKTASWGPEKHYVMIRARKEGDRRRSYLPYRQDLVGFFTNVNGFSRNVHPF
ncbi:uncharacterized protein LOC129321269 [Prosopis cineraria]|uniref:uncharacterized protein LOC129321269 n=1 Tax=Prosopis cineraria TaxID=364024 RepID=UPI00240F1304|nr:uncharacterized protein LOC129321269 [Prosopis cineraria]